MSQSSNSVSVFDSPAVALLCELETAARDAGVPLTIAVTSEGRLQIAPRSVLTEDRAALVRTHRDALRLLVWCCDSGVQARRAMFTRTVEASADSAGVPALRYRRGVEARAGQCVSCGDATAAPAWCWRCQLAARLAVCGDAPCDWIPAGDTLPRLTAAAA